MHMVPLVFMSRAGGYITCAFLFRPLFITSAPLGCWTCPPRALSSWVDVDHSPRRRRSSNGIIPGSCGNRRDCNRHAQWWWWWLVLVAVLCFEDSPGIVRRARAQAFRHHRPEPTHHFRAAKGRVCPSVRPTSLTNNPPASGLIEPWSFFLVSVARFHSVTPRNPTLPPTHLVLAVRLT